jgi:hypothetical protein
MRIWLLSLALAGGLLAQTPPAPKFDLLWPKGAPGALGADDADNPAMTPHVVPAGRSTGTAVIVCPGGSYQHLSMDKWRSG